MSFSEPPTSANPPAIETVVVCYSQAAFDNLEKLPATGEDEAEEPEAGQARYISQLAEGLLGALREAGCTAEIVRLPQRSFAPRDISKAAFAWRLLDLKESNGRKIDLALCLDFPAWSLQHPNKVVWLTQLPNFVVRSRVALPPEPANQAEGQPITIQTGRNETEQERARQVSGLLQAERRGVAEARRLLTGSRPVAEEMARRGLQAEYNPLPTDLSLPPTDPQWQTPLRRLLRKY